jgi:hypothetical protein
MAYNEDLFTLEVKEKKQLAHSHRSRTGRGSSKSRKGMSTPFDFMSKAEKEKLNGEVKLTNLFDTIISREEFETMDEKQQKAMMLHWRDIYPNTKIMKEMGISSSGAFHGIINRLEIPRKGRVDDRRKGNGKKIQNKKALAPTVQAPQIATTPIIENFVQQPVKLITNGLHLEYIGNFNSEQINKILTKIQLLVDGEENNFNIELSISECEKKEHKEEGDNLKTSL